MICFGLLFMRLFTSHDSGHEFRELTQIDSSHLFVSFFIDFSISIPSFQLCLLGIKLHNFFNLLFMRLFQSHDRGFVELTQVFFSFF